MFDRLCSHWNSCCFMLCFLILSTPIQAGLPEPSPAGGNYLSLNGENEYAMLDFKETGTLLDANTTKLTVEAWVYPTSMPEEDTYGVILGQQLFFFVVDNENSYYAEVFKACNVEWSKDDLFLVMIAYYNAGGGANTGFIPLTLSLNKWHHIAFQAQENQTIWICDNISKSANGGLFGLKIAWYAPEKDFVIGGYGQEFPMENTEYSLGGFSGYIDEVRVSDIPRYEVDGQLIPQGRFEPDTNTIALWHFDEHNGSHVFHDASNKHSLIGKNGATTNGPIVVNRRDKLTTTWAVIKVDNGR